MLRCWMQNAQRHPHVQRTSTQIASSEAAAACSATTAAACTAVVTTQCQATPQRMVST